MYTRFVSSTSKLQLCASIKNRLVMCILACDSLHRNIHTHTHTYIHARMQHHPRESCTNIFISRRRSALQGGNANPKRVTYVQEAHTTYQQRAVVQPVARPYGMCVCVCERVGAKQCTRASIGEPRERVKRIQRKGRETRNVDGRCEKSLNDRTSNPNARRRRHSEEEGGGGDRGTKREQRYNVW